MQRLFLSPLGKKAYSLLEPADAIQFSALCKGPLNLDAALLFALSRSELHASGSPLDMGTWESLWDVCAKSVAACGLDPGKWAYSQRLVCHFGDLYSDYVHSEIMLFDGGVFSFLARLLKQAQRQDVPEVKLLPEPAVNIVDSSKGEIAAILMTDFQCYFPDLSGYRFGPAQQHEAQPAMRALVVCSDGRFALMFYDEGFGAVYIANTLSALFDFIHAESGEKCHWQLNNSEYEYEYDYEHNAEGDGTEADDNEFNDSSYDGNEHDDESEADDNEFNDYEYNGNEADIDFTYLTLSCHPRIARQTSTQSHEMKLPLIRGWGSATPLVTVDTQRAGARLAKRLSASWQHMMPGTLASALQASQPTETTGSEEQVAQSIDHDSTQRLSVCIDRSTTTA